MRPAVCSMNALHHHSDEPKAAAAGEKQEEDADSRPWVLRSRRRLSVKLTVIAILIPIVTIFVVAITLGMTLNNEYTGSYTGKRGAIKPASDGSPASGEATLDALSSGCASAAVAAGAI